MIWPSGILLTANCRSPKSLGYWAIRKLAGSHTRSSAGPARRPGKRAQALRAKFGAPYRGAGNWIFPERLTRLKSSGFFSEVDHVLDQGRIPRPGGAAKIHRNRTKEIQHESARSNWVCVVVRWFRRNAGGGKLVFKPLSRHKSQYRFCAESNSRTNSAGTFGRAPIVFVSRWSEHAKQWAINYIVAGGTG